MRKGFVYCFLIALSVLLTQASCATSDGLSKSERRALLASRVTQSLSDRHYTIDVTTAHPSNYPAVILHSSYSLTVSGDSLISYLPYFGEAYFSVSYGGGNPMHFTGKINSYEETLKSKNEHQIRLTTRNNDDIYTFSINVFDNGKAYINVVFYNRTYISYNGEMIFE